MLIRLFNFTLVGLLLAAFLTAGCERQIESKDPVRSLPGRLPAPSNLTAAIGDRSVTLSWDMETDGGVARYRIYTAIGTAAGFTRHDSTTSLTTTLSDLPFNQAIRFRVTAVGSGGIEGDPSETVTATVGLLSVLIQNGDEFTNSRDVQIRLAVPGAAVYVMLSEDSLFGGASTLVFQSTMPFTLSHGDGTKKVYAAITFQDGSSSVGDVFDEVVLDSYAAVDSVFFSPSGQTFGEGDVISFFLDAGGEIGGEAVVSFPGSGEIALLDDGSHGDALADDGRYSFDFTVPVGLTVTDGKLVGDFIDAAGNQADQATASEDVDIEIGALPDSVILAVGLTDATTARLSWTRSTDEEFASYRIYRDTSPSVSMADDLIAIITEVNTLNHDDFLPNPGAYYYRVYVFDNQGQFRGSNEVSVTR
ncbi:MAG: fibronectin type III domain-containing protein [bacterium]|nr:fibronectin type III domain-containing protein [bacterium]